MKVQQIKEFGAPDVFHAADIEPRTPGPRQIRVRQMATSVNPVDTKLRAAGPPIAPALPAVLGCDVAGVVDSYDVSCVADSNEVSSAADRNDVAGVADSSDLSSVAG